LGLLAQSRCIDCSLRSRDLLCSLAEEITPPIAPCRLLGPLAEAGARWPLPSSLASLARPGQQRASLLSKAARDFSTLAPVLGLLAQSRAEIHLLRRRSQRKERLRSLHVDCSLRSLSTAARDFSTLAALVRGLTRARTGSGSPSWLRGPRTLVVDTARRAA
jgi:hypothetical protein